VHGRQLLLLLLVLQLEQVLVLQLQLLLHLGRADQGLHRLLLLPRGRRLLPRGVQLLQRHLQIPRGAMDRRQLSPRGAVALLGLLLLLLVLWAALALPVATTAACLRHGRRRYESPARSNNMHADEG
jgi:hypothetical protein